MGLELTTSKKKRDGFRFFGGKGGVRKEDPATRAPSASDASVRQVNGSNVAVTDPPAAEHSESRSAGQLPQSFSLSSERKVQKFLREHRALRILVGDDYTIYYVRDGKTTAMCAQLQVFLREEYRTAPAEIPMVEIDEAEYKQAATQARKSSARVKRDEEEELANPNVALVLDAAIRSNASDIYLDVNRNQDTASVHLRVYGERHFWKEYDALEGERLARALFRQDPKAHYIDTKPCNCAFDYKTVRVRGSLLPEERGVSTVFRARDPNFNLPLEGIGYSELQQTHIHHMIRAPGGLGVVSGPTNSGKSTTLSSIMAGLPATQKIIEIADPVEVLFPHIAHVPIDHYRHDADALFKQFLAELVRQNPDSLFIGEIRDAQTADASKNMSIQGKRVWTTLHTTQCSTAIPRLDNLGVEDHLLQMPGFLTGLISQNLVPVLCRHCCLKEGPEDQYSYGPNTRYRNKDGCSDPKCYKGISGQTIVAEVWPLCIEEAEDAFQFIVDKDFVGLRKYMRETVGAPRKEAHALEKVEAGICDPFAVQEIIGEFPPSLFASRERTSVRSGHMNDIADSAP